jgi:hypothetical protein
MYIVVAATLCALPVVAVDDLRRCLLENLSAWSPKSC